MRPIIGITSGLSDGGDYLTRKRYADAVTLAGGIPVILPYMPDSAEEVLAHCGGLIFSGGVRSWIQAFIISSALSGVFVMTASMSRSRSAFIAAGSSTVHGWTRIPISCALETISGCVRICP